MNISIPINEYKALEIREDKVKKAIDIINDARKWIDEHDTKIYGKPIVRTNFLDRNTVERYLTDIEQAYREEIENNKEGEWGFVHYDHAC